MDAFETLLTSVYTTVERYVKYKVSGPDAEDLLQEICLTAFLKFHQLDKKESFKAWILSIARNRCNDYYRAARKQMEIPLEEIPEGKLVYGRRGWIVSSPVEDTLELLTSRYQEILRLFYWNRLSVAEISARLGIPIGTVKSRLNTAREHFKKQYPYPPKGENTMTKLPKIMPQYTIERLEKAPFACKWEELQGWQIIPRLGEKLSWGLYNFPTGERLEYTEMEVVGRAEVHGIEGVEVVAVQYDSEDYFRTGSIDRIERRFIAQLTDTHSRYLAESHTENGIRKVNVTKLRGKSSVSQKM